MKERPTSVTVFAVINMVFAGLGVLGLIIGLVFRLGLIELPDTGRPNSAKDLMESNAGFRLYSDVNMGLMFLATILIVAASVGMFQLRPWARLATIGWGVYSVFMKVIGAVIQHMLITTPMIDQAPVGAERNMMIIITGVGFAFVLGLIGYHLLMIYMLSRPAVVEAFTPGDADDDRGGWDRHPGPGSEPGAGGRGL